MKEGYFLHIMLLNVVLAYCCCTVLLEDAQCSNCVKPFKILNKLNWSYYYMRFEFTSYCVMILH